MSTKDILSDPKQLIPFLNRKLYEKEITIDKDF